MIAATLADFARFVIIDHGPGVLSMLAVLWFAVWFATD